ncbi:hypothetical protein LCGC14_2140370 [marine sediment metagenome]|uniref:dihydrolipoyllysine-residue succinyltransferase n=1 Tax=marine sediment metagenome TaxID=412755 RepID=A0A0F9DYH7_9ZZZZ
MLPIWSLVFAAGAPLLSVYAVAAFAAASILLIFAVLWPKDGRTRWPDAGSGLSVRAALSELAAPAVLARTLILGTVHGGISLYLILTGLILSGVPGRDAGDVAIFVAIVAGLEMPVMLIAPRLLPRLGITRLICAATLLYALFLCAFPLLAGSAMVWALTVPAAMGAGVMLSMPILNPPQSGILGLHKIEKRPVVDGDAIVARSMMYAALSYDHRIIDGREAVTFLVRIKELIEDPQRLVLDL